MYLAGVLTQRASRTLFGRPAMPTFYTLLDKLSSGWRINGFGANGEHNEGDKSLGGSP